MSRDLSTHATLSWCEDGEISYYGSPEEAVHIAAEERGILRKDWGVETSWFTSEQDVSEDCEYGYRIQIDPETGYYELSADEKRIGLLPSVDAAKSAAEKHQEWLLSRRP